MRREDGRAQTRTGLEEYMSDFSTADWQKTWSDEGYDKNPLMKPFKDQLTPAQIQDLVQHVRSLAVPK